SHGSDSDVARLHRLGDLPVRFLGLSLEQLGDQFALFLGGKMTAMDVGADDVRGRIGLAVESNKLVSGEKNLARYEARRADFDRLARYQLDGVEAVATVEQLLRRFWIGAPQRNGAGESVPDDVCAERLEFVRRHAREKFGGRDGSAVCRARAL